MAKKKFKLFDRKGNKLCSGCREFLPIENYYKGDENRPSYCKPCRKECNQRSRTRRSERMIIKQDHERRNRQITLIRNEFKKAVEAALKHQDYSQYLVNSMDATRDLFGAQQNEYAALQYSALRFR